MLHVGELPSGVLEKLEREEISEIDAENYLRFRERKQREIDGHDGMRNRYTLWFKEGTASDAQIRDFYYQFGGFSRLFPIIQALRVYYAETEEEEEDARSILANEYGVGIDMETGNTEGKKFSHKSAHIKWLRDAAEVFDIARMELGLWELCSHSTQEFLEQLTGIYGHKSHNKRAAASFAVETWAGFGIGGGEEAESNNFWKELITGFSVINNRREQQGLPGMPMGFFLYHFALERAHVANVEHELEEAFFSPEFDEEEWFEGARTALDAVNIFWLGLEETRKQLA